MISKEISLIISMCLNNQDSYSSDELAQFLELKFTNGVYPYIKKLSDKGLITKFGKGKYSLNKKHNKVRDIEFIVGIFSKDSFLLLTNQTKRILRKFSKEPIIGKEKFTQNDLRIIKEFVGKAKIIHTFKDKGKEEAFFIACWEEPTKKILDFFDIPLNFDIDEFKHNVVKYYSSSNNTQSPLDEKTKTELKKLNMEAHILGKDTILDKLKETSFSFLSIAKVLTEEKKKQFIPNPFSITSKINDWKMKYIYNTDKIEGNPLSMQEVRTILTTGQLLGEQEKKFILETINSRTALENIFDTNNELNIEFVKKLHLATQTGIDIDAGEYKKTENCITDNNNYLIDTTTPVEFVEKRMDELINWYQKNKEKIHPFVLASIVHNQFAYIHPFNDGNGRVARLIFNFILIKEGFFPIIFFNDEKHKYYSYLRASKRGDIKQFVSHCLDLYRVQLDEF